VDCIVILEGDQGIGKSSVLRVVFDGDNQGWFTDEIADLGSKDSAMQLAGVWCIEMAELDAMSRAEVSRTKSFASRTNDRYRPPYGKRVVDVERQCVFAGSVNEAEYLRDPTGGRRFWPVKCTKADWKGVYAAREQLWAEAVTRYRRREKWFLHEKALIDMAAEEQAARQWQHPWTEKIEEWLNKQLVHVKNGGVTVGEILEGALFKNVEKWTPSDAITVGKCMKELGWEKYQARVGGGSHREWRYRLSQSAAQPVTPWTPVTEN